MSIINKVNRFKKFQFHCGHHHHHQHYFHHHHHHHHCHCHCCQSETLFLIIQLHITQHFSSLFIITNFFLFFTLNLFSANTITLQQQLRKRSEREKSLSLLEIKIIKIGLTEMIVEFK